MKKICALLGILMWLQPLLPSASPTNTEKPTRKTRIVVFVHGIMSIKPHLSFANFMRFMQDEVEDTIYSETVRYMRDDPFFYQNQPMEEIGWHKIDLNRVERGYASGLMARMFERVEKLVNPDHPYENHYYNYGWYGLLSARIRYFDAIPLYHYLLAEVAKFRAQGIEPEIRLIGYSHGGNVCLNLGAVRQNEPVDQSLSIDELVLVGVPIQCETDFLINDPIFKKIYQQSSRGDRIQTLDFFSTKRFFSRNHFKARSCFNLPNKLMQVELRLTRETTKKRPGRCACQEKDPCAPHAACCTSTRLRDASAGHIELWFFGWTPANYREDFILNPLPVIIFLPLVLHHIDQMVAQYSACFDPRKQIILDIRPERQHMLLRYQTGWKDALCVPFPKKEVVDELKAMTKAYEPTSYTAEDYDYHIQLAIDKAERAHHQQQKIRGRRRRRDHHVIRKKRHPMRSVLVS
jgi:hypothetical protein